MNCQNHRPDDADPDDFVGLRSLSNDDLIRLAQELGPRYSLLVWLGAYFGLRYQEAAGLTGGSVENLLQGEVKIGKS